MDKSGQENTFTDAAAEFPNSASPTYTRVPNNLIGKLLGYEKVSGYALHLLAIKCGRGDGFSLNETAVNKPANAQSASRRRSERFRGKPVPEKPDTMLGSGGSSGPSP